MQHKEFLSTIERLRRQGTDDAFVEAKACVEELSNDIWESVSSFANTNGGTLMLGLDENNGFSPAQGFDIDRTIDQFVSGIGDGGGEGKAAQRPAL